MKIIQEIVVILQGKGTVVKSYMYESSTRVQKYLDRGLLIEPVHPRVIIVHYDFLHLHYIRCKSTHVGLLSVGALVQQPC